MQKILKGSEVKLLDKLHLSQTNLSSIELMENASKIFVVWLLEKEFDRSLQILIACGAGNNGGDGLAIARLLKEHQLNVAVLQCFHSVNKLSEDALANWNALPDDIPVFLAQDDFPKTGILIDAYLGVGLKGELRDSAKQVIYSLSDFQGRVISVDVPSGLPADEVKTGLTIEADYTISFGFPKLSLLLPENATSVGELVVLNIGISNDAYDQFESDYYFLKAKAIPALHKSFNRFSHKGDFGKVLLVGGSPGKMGALILCTTSALRTGSGLVSSHTEESEHQVIQTALPEAMATWGVIADPQYYDAIGMGPGWGQDNRDRLMRQLLQDFKKPVVIDADGLNLIARHKDLLDVIPPNSILTPHLGEFARLVGDSKDHLERLAKAKEFAQSNNVILVLKGANTCISMPDGRQVFNSSGTHYMATGGSGDVLTGMITSYLGQGYSPENAALCGVFHHGLAGEIASRTKRRSLIASDIIDAIPATYFELGIE